MNNIVLTALVREQGSSCDHSVKIGSEIYLVIQHKIRLRFAPAATGVIEARKINSDLVSSAVFHTDGSESNHGSHRTRIVKIYWDRLGA